MSREERIELDDLDSDDIDKSLNDENNDEHDENTRLGVNTATNDDIRDVSDSELDVQRPLLAHSPVTSPDQPIVTRRSVKQVRYADNEGTAIELDNLLANTTANNEETAHLETNLGTENEERVEENLTVGGGRESDENPILKNLAKMVLIATVVFGLLLAGLSLISNCIIRLEFDEVS